MANFKLTIDGVAVEAESGMTVLQAAKNAGLFIPSLCAHEELSPYGACRLCVVEIDGVRGTPTSCTTPAAEGMVVRTNTEQLQLQRKRTIELMMSGHPSPCLSCDSREECESEKAVPTRAGHATRCGTCSNRPGCELREIALKNYAPDIKLPVLYDSAKVERNDPFIDKDHNLCVLCGRCFRVCEHIHGKPAISIVNRGKKAKVAVEFEKAWSAEDCTFCGACVEECPTGSLTDRWGKWFGKEEKTGETICPICPRHCKVSLKVKDGRVIGVRSVSLKKEDALCALGKFAIPQLANARERLLRLQMRKGGELMPCTGEEAVERAVEMMKNGKKILFIGVKGSFYETRKGIRALAAHLKADLFELGENEESLPGKLAADIANGVYDTAFELGNYLSPQLASKIEHLAVADFLKSPVYENAELVIPFGAFGETAGTFENPQGEKITASAVVPSRGDQRPLSGVVCEICKRLEIDAKPHSFQMEPLPEGFKSPAEDKKYLPDMYLGHFLADYVPDLVKIGLRQSPAKADKMSAAADSGFEILATAEIAPNFHEVKVYAPEMAKYARPGQFAILMANPDSERSPFTIIDWNAEEGWVKFILEEVGRSSSEVAALKAGDKLAVVSGPLGTPMDLDAFKSGSNALLLGGCYGIGAIYPIARELKKRGVLVTCAIEASTSYMLYYKDRLASVSDRLIVRTRDGTEGERGGCRNVLREIGAGFDAAVVIGCVFMMKQCAADIPVEVKTALCALNPIMVDGTGMCGACRVSVGGETKFACVDGPVFPLREVDFAELAKRRSAYKLLEIDAMPRHIGGRCHS